MTSSTESPAPSLSAGDASPWLQDRRIAFDEIVAAVEEYAIFTMNGSGAILDWNRGAERIIGYTAGEIRNDGQEPAMGLGFLVFPAEGMTGEATPAP